MRACALHWLLPVCAADQWRRGMGRTGCNGGGSTQPCCPAHLPRPAAAPASPARPSTRGPWPAWPPGPGSGRAPRPPPAAAAGSGGTEEGGLGCQDGEAGPATQNWRTGEGTRVRPAPPGAAPPALLSRGRVVPRPARAAAGAVLPPAPPLSGCPGDFTCLKRAYTSSIMASTLRRCSRSKPGARGRGAGGSGHVGGAQAHGRRARMRVSAYLQHAYARVCGCATGS